jgi:hypothetical protein
MAWWMRYLPAGTPQFVAPSTIASLMAFERRPLILHHLPIAIRI